jgi:phage/plasmid primase-like uncharacterized protein
MKTRTVAAVLSAIFGAPSDVRQRHLRKNAARFETDGTLHRIYDYDRDRGVWTCVCGVYYNGNAYVEAPSQGQLTCMASIAWFDVDG